MRINGLTPARPKVPRVAPSDRVRIVGGGSDRLLSTRPAMQDAAFRRRPRAPIATCSSMATVHMTKGA